MSAQRRSCTRPTLTKRKTRTRLEIAMCGFCAFYSLAWLPCRLSGCVSSQYWLRLLTQSPVSHVQNTPPNLYYLGILFLPST